MINIGSSMTLYHIIVHIKVNSVLTVVNDMGCSLSYGTHPFTNLYEIHIFLKRCTCSGTNPDVGPVFVGSSIPKLQKNGPISMHICNERHAQWFCRRDSILKVARSS